MGSRSQTPGRIEREEGERAYKSEAVQPRVSRESPPVCQSWTCAPPFSGFRTTFSSSDILFLALKLLDSFKHSGLDLTDVNRHRRVADMRCDSMEPHGHGGDGDDAGGVRIVEVGPRDGLQNIRTSIPTSTKLELIKRLHATGLRSIEVTSVVSPKAIPQLADNEAVLSSNLVQSLLRKDGLGLSTLVPNTKGLDVAIRHGVKEVAVFVSASEAFSRANINCSVAEGLDRARKVAEKAKANGLFIRGYVYSQNNGQLGRCVHSHLTSRNSYVSCIFACPYDGPTPLESVIRCVDHLLSIGCYEVSLGDTTGIGTPSTTKSLLHYLIQENGIPSSKLAGHFHDTYGQAISNVWAAYECGLRVFDSSVGGLGGCPYARGAKGNVATEDVVSLFEERGIKTGVNLEQLVKIGAWITTFLQVRNQSKIGSTMPMSRPSMKRTTTYMGKEVGTVISLVGSVSDDILESHKKTCCRIEVCQCTMS